MRIPLPNGTVPGSDQVLASFLTSSALPPGVCSDSSHDTVRLPSRTVGNSPTPNHGHGAVNLAPSAPSSSYTPCAFAVFPFHLEEIP